MRTIEESIAVLEKWREEDEHRLYYILSPVEVWVELAVVKLQTIQPDEVSNETLSYKAATLQEALDKAASAVEGE